MSRKKIMKSWDETWEDFKGPNPLALWYLDFVKKEISKMLREVKLHKKSKIIDIGCGTGRTLIWFKDFGYENSLGIDQSKSSIDYCKNLNLKVREMNAFKTKFRNKHFDLVFSEGLLEHFDKSDAKKIIKEMCRVSKKYVLLSQPNRSSVYRKLADIFYLFIKEKGPPEKDYSIDDFVRSFSENKFELKKISTVTLGGFWLLLFERRLK